MFWNSSGSDPRNTKSDFGSNLDPGMSWDQGSAITEFLIYQRDFNRLSKIKHSKWWRSMFSQ